MRKLAILVVSLMSFVFVYGQQSDEKSTYVYGVDYRFCKVFGADESVEDFAKAFCGINRLLVTESDKYDFAKVLRKRVNIVVSPMIALHEECRFDDMLTLDKVYNNVDCEAVVNGYKLKESVGTGVVLIAKWLDKAVGEGVYELIVFDVASRQIVYRKEAVGSARGFGLRNYWAGSVYDVLKGRRVKY